MSSLDTIRKHINKYKDLLENLSRRNREIYFKESRAGSINLSKHPRALNDQFKFSGLQHSTNSMNNLIESGKIDLSSHFFLNELPDTDLIKRLDKVRLADEKFQKEYGISGAWLLGPFLCWRDKSIFERSDLLITPILKFPINLVKDKRKNWQMILEETTLQANPALLLAMKKRWGIDLTPCYQADSIEELLRNIDEKLKEDGKNLFIVNNYEAVPKTPKKMKVVKDEDGNITERVQVPIEESLNAEDLKLYDQTTNKDFFCVDVFYIDHLNASRAVLTNDYEKILEADDIHPILSELFNGVPAQIDSKVSKDKIRELDAYKEKENYFVVNIDSTQHRAIDKSNNSRALVIQGPPGTGKSQTITNLIADNLAKGKKVLFVSEKRPALDVVFAR